MEIVKAHIAWRWPCERRAVGISPCTAVGSGPRNAQCQQNPSCCGYGITCATLSLVIVQRRAPCLCNADPCAHMPVQCQSRCHDLHTFGPTPPVFPGAIPTQPCAKRWKICIGELICVESVLADCHQHAKHSPSWWQSEVLPKQRSKAPHTQCTKTLS